MELQEKYNLYDNIINDTIKKIYSKIENNEIVFNYSKKFCGKKFYFEIVKILCNLDPNLKVIVKMNPIKFYFLKKKNKNLKLERDKKNREPFLFLDITIFLLEKYKVKSSSILDDIYNTYYKKGVKIK